MEGGRDFPPERTGAGWVGSFSVFNLVSSIQKRTKYEQRRLSVSMETVRSALFLEEN